ncbi:MAG: hypothetical protein VX899_04245 [Myxococcota bacterium]|nr:hypothetical protein [Myxococcota bacterium]
MLSYLAFSFPEAACLRRWEPAGKLGMDYEVLGAEPGARIAEVSSPFRRRAKVLHPDNGGLALDFVDLRSARGPGVGLAEEGVACLKWAEITDTVGLGYVERA